MRLREQKSLEVSRMRPMNPDVVARAVGRLFCFRMRFSTMRTRMHKLTGT